VAHRNRRQEYPENRRWKRTIQPLRDIFTGYGKDGTMSLLGWALIFLVVAIVAAALGFGGIASAAAGIAKVLFFVFLVIFVVLLIMGLVGRPV